MRLVAVLVAALAMCLGVGHGDALSNNRSHAPHDAQFYRNVPKEVAPYVPGKHNAHSGLRVTRARVSLAARARYLAVHGGITGHCYACATSRMKALVRALIRETFRPAGWAAVTHALCYSRRESGWNPGAVSPTHDHSSFQVNAPSHPQFDYWRMDHDPAYGVEAGWVVSSHGRDWGPGRADRSHVDLDVHRLRRVQADPDRVRVSSLCGLFALPRTDPLMGGHHPDGWTCHRGHVVPPGRHVCHECKWWTDWRFL